MLLGNVCDVSIEGNAIADVSAPASPSITVRTSQPDVTGGFEAMFGGGECALVSRGGLQ